MTDKEIVERVKEAEKRTGFGELVHSTISKGVNSAFGIGFVEGMVEYRNSLQEEPVSEDDENALNSVAITFLQEQQIVPNFYADIIMKAVKRGAKWQKEQMMKDAVEGEVKIDAGGYPYVDATIELYDYDKDIPLAKEGDKVKILVIRNV